MDAKEYVFDDALREELRSDKYARWAANLNRNQILWLLHMVGEFAVRVADKARPSEFIVFSEGPGLGGRPERMADALDEIVFIYRGGHRE